MARHDPAAEVDLTIGEDIVRLRGALATPNLFRLLGVRPALGRTFDNDDRDVAILSDGLWHRAFGGEPGAIGRTLRVTFGRERRQKTVTVIGILPRAISFTYPDGSDIWLPLSWDDLAATPNVLRYQVLARLRPGATISSATAEVAGIYEAYEDARRAPAHLRSTAWLEPLHDYSVGRTKYALALLLAVTSLVLVTCCGSVITLFAAQGITRRREVGVRLALGATRVRVAQQLVLESVFVGMAASAVAVVAAWSLVPAFGSLLPTSMPRVDQVGLDLATVAWATLCGTVAIALTSFAPVALSVSVDPATALAVNPAGTSRPRTARSRQWLIGFQVALVTLLLVVGGRLIHGFWQLSHVELGFESSGIMTAEMRFLGPAYRDEAKLRSVQEQILAGVRAIPIVTEASAASSVPFRGVDWTRQLRAPAGGDPIMANERLVDRAYFRLMSIPLQSGRLFDVTDNIAAPPVAVISESLAQRLFPESDPLGRTLNSRTPATIVGVVGDVRARQVEDAANPAYYLHSPQVPSTMMCLVIRTRADESQLKGAVVAAVRSVDPKQPIQQFAWMDDIVSSTIADRRFFAIATTALALVTLMLATTGVFGVHVATISERTREFGIRATIGATPTSQVRRTLLSGLIPILTGSLLGALGAWWSTQLIQQYVFPIGETRAFVFAAGAAAVVVLGGVTCAIPAIKIARLDIAKALRAE
ncbi:MAG: ABC transporter permease [Cyanobacteria bacterium]|nr:ABC transporter permease [Cyanobacteriota bacterium]